MSRILVVDDEASIGWAFRSALGEDGHDVRLAASAEDAYAITEDFSPHCVVLDVRLPGADGLSSLRRLRERIGSAPVIVITAFGDLETAVRAVEAGAFDYLPKPFDLAQAVEVIRRALEFSQPAPELPTGESEEKDEDALVGVSPVMQEIFKRIALVAGSQAPVLITGESGAGKEMIARAIHRHSSRREGPFVPVCLAALNPALVESELFGHARGSFTGALGDRAGLFALAAGGTIFLDEIADTPLDLQVKLLRVLERREFSPVGDAKARTTDVRVLAATNRPLPERVAEGAFREDLYYRLNVFPIEAPPLRERRADIPALAERFIRAIVGGRPLQLSPEFLQALCERSWPGNVRELKHAVEHAALMARGDRLRPEHLPAETRDANDEPARRIERWVAEWTRLAAADATSEGLHERLLAILEPPMLRAALELRGGARAAAADLLGIHRATLRQKLRRYGIDDEP